ncbi:MAG: hypothetical protein V3S31_04180 [Dehalococcoidia bacterium]
MPEFEIVTSDRSGCVHHWLLSDPAAGEIYGECRRCLATRSFPASPESTQRFDDYREMTAPTGYAQRLSA